MNQSHCLQALQIALTANVPVLIWGEPGAGKTAAVNALAARLDWPMETVLASLREPSDFAGLPVIEGTSVRFAPADWARRLAGTERSICFFDEITTAAPSTQKALLRVIHERVVGDLALGPGVRMIAAANPAEIATGGWDLSPPLANRFAHLDWTIDPGVVAAGLLGRWPEPTPLHPRGDWETRVTHHAAVVSGFLAARPDLVHVRPDEEDLAGRSWPSPRTWDLLCRVLAAAEDSGIDPEALSALVVGLVGQGAAIEFIRFRRDLDLPDPEALLRRPSSYRRPRRDDQVHAVVAAVTAAVIASTTPPRWTQALEVFCEVASAGNLDIAAVGVRAIATLRPDGADIPAGLVVFGEVLVAAGLIGADGRVRSETLARSS